jgi:hypothetical protein
VTVDSFSYLWDGSDEGWALVRLANSPLPVIFNQVTRTALAIEDDETYADVVQRMIDQGAKVLDHLP